MTKALDASFRDRGQIAAVMATDALEHLTKDGVMDTFDRVAKALIPGGIFVVRVPNAAR